VMGPTMFDVSPHLATQAYGQMLGGAAK